MAFQEQIVESLIIPLAIFLMVGFWGAYETGRKFRKEFKKRGKSWDALCAQMNPGQPGSAGGGTVIVDTLWGPQQGYGHPVIWYSPRALVQGEDLAAELESTASLVRAPRNMRSAEAMRRKFGRDRVVVHTWSIDLSLVDNAHPTR